MYTESGKNKQDEVRSTAVHGSPHGPARTDHDPAAPVATVRWRARAHRTVAPSHRLTGRRSGRRVIDYSAETRAATLGPQNHG